MHNRNQQPDARGIGNRVQAPQMLNESELIERKKSILKKLREDFDKEAVNASANTNEKRTFNFLHAKDPISWENYIQDSKITEENPLVINNFIYSTKTGQVYTLDSLLSIAKELPQGTAYSPVNIVDYLPLSSKEIVTVQVLYEIILHNDELLAALQLSTCNTEITNLSEVLNKAVEHIKEYEQNTSEAKSFYEKYKDNIEAACVQTLNGLLVRRFHYRINIPKTLQAYDEMVKRLYTDDIRKLYHSYKNGNQPNNRNTSNSLMLTEMHRFLETLLRQPWYITPIIM